MSLALHSPLLARGSLKRTRPVHRWAVAAAELSLDSETFSVLQSDEKRALSFFTAGEVAGALSVEKLSDFLPQLVRQHLDYTAIHFEQDLAHQVVIAYAHVAGMSTESLNPYTLHAAHSALLAVTDRLVHTLGSDFPAVIGNLRVIARSDRTLAGTWIEEGERVPDWVRTLLPSAKPLENLRVAITVMSDRASAGVYADESGALLQKFLLESGAEIVDYRVIPDNTADIESTLRGQVQTFTPDMIVTSGGTGPGPRDITPDVLEKICDRILEGLGDVLRTQSLHYTDTAWLSRMTAGMLGATFIMAFPGSPRAVSECWDIVFPFLGDAIQKIKKQGFEVKK